MVLTPQTRMAASLDDVGAGNHSISMVHRIVAFLRGSAQPQTRLMKRVETLPLGPKRALYLVECDGDRFLIAAGGDGVSAPVPLTQRFTARDASARTEQP